MDQAPAILVALLVVLIATHAGGWVARRIRQPAVIGEMAAGLLLSPALLGAFAPAWHQAVFTPVGIAGVARIGTIAIVVFMFLVASTAPADSTDPATKSTTALIVTASSLAMPFALGAAVSWRLYPEMAGAATSWPIFALFLGTALSVTAFPVLARILSSFNRQHSSIGRLALRCAALDDVAAWGMLAALTAATRADTAPWRALGGVAAFVATMAIVLRPVLAAVMARVGARGALAVLGVGLAASAMTAEWVGLHAALGAFLFGATVAPASAVISAWRPQIERICGWMLPAFFGVAGLNVGAGAFSAGVPWAAGALLMAAAFAGKIGGAYLGARAERLPHRDALAIGVLMNARGLVGLVVVSIGADLHIVGPALSTMLITMIIVTTAATSPLLTSLGWRISPRTPVTD